VLEGLFLIGGGGGPTSTGAFGGALALPAYEQEAEVSQPLNCPLRAMRGAKECHLPALSLQKTTLSAKIRPFTLEEIRSHLPLHLEPHEHC